MKWLLMLVVLAVVLAAQGGVAKDKVPDCDQGTKVVKQKDGGLDLEDKEKQVCMVTLPQLHPTQFAVGMSAVQCKKQKLESKDQKKKLEKDLAEEDNWVPMVRGPGGLFYLTDHHHLSVALYNAHLQHTRKELYAYLVADFSDSKSYQEFWERMVQHHYAWLEDHTGTPKPAIELPTQVQYMTDDPMRTLSAWVRESCGYVKCGETDCTGAYKEVTCAPSSTYFLEFKWADYLRNLDGVKTAMGAHAACNDQEDLEKGTCVSGQHDRLGKALAVAMPAVARPEAKAALGEGGGYNAKAHNSTPQSIDCHKD